MDGIARALPLIKTQLAHDPSETRMKGTRRNKKSRTTILLTDLDPRKDERGRSGKSLFGEQSNKLEQPGKPAKATRSRAAKRSSPRKGR